MGPPVTNRMYPYYSSYGSREAAASPGSAGVPAGRDNEAPQGGCSGAMWAA